MPMAISKLLMEMSKQQIHENSSCILLIVIPIVNDCQGFLPTILQVAAQNSNRLVSFQGFKKIFL